MVLKSRRTVAAVVTASIAIIAPLGAVAASSATAAAPHANVVTTTHSTLTAWAEGNFRIGQAITIDADGHDARGVTFDKATVIGPAGIKGYLTPAADAGHLTGDIHIPSHIRATWIRLTIVAPNGTTSHLVIHAKAAQTTKPVAHTNRAWSKAWAEGKFQPGKTITIDADGYDARGQVLDSAKVSGPYGIKASLTPAADAGHLTGDVFIPKSVKLNILPLQVKMSNGQSIVVNLQRR